MNKAYNRTYWENYPSDASPVNEANLNKIEGGVDEIDNRVITLDTTKFDKTEAAKLIKSITFDRVTGIFTITYYNGATATIDTMLEKLAVNFDYDSQTQQLIITLDDETVKYVDMSALITQYEFKETDTVAFTVDSTGKVSAIVKEGSIQEKHLQPNYLADIKVESAKAEASASAAATSASAAAVSETNAKASENAAKTSETNAKVSETNTKTSEANAKASEQAAAESEANALSSEQAAKASEQVALESEKKSLASEQAAKASEQAAAASEANAKSYKDYAMSYAVGTDGEVRPGDAIDNASYYYEQAKRISQGLQGALMPMGTITFAQLATMTAQPGYMYNISDDFTTDDTFNEGEGHEYPAGTNVYRTADGAWDCMAGPAVGGVKGAREATYRQGLVSLTAENVGALPEEGDSAENTLTFDSGDAEEANVWTDVDTLVSGEKHNSILNKVSTMFRNIRYLYKMLGNTDISDHGGTVTNAILLLSGGTSDLQDQIDAQNDALATVNSSLVTTNNKIAKLVFGTRVLQNVVNQNYIDVTFDKSDGTSGLICIFSDVITDNYITCLKYLGGSIWRMYFSYTATIATNFRINYIYKINV